MPALADQLSQRLGLDPSRLRAEPAGGGCIAETAIFDDGQRRVFVKRMPVERSEVLEAERDGLQRIAATGAIRVPRVLAADAADDGAWLALECLQLQRATGKALAAMGKALAGLHRERAGRHGLEIDNFIGETPQRNTPDADWTAFFFDCRLGDQMARLARRHSGFGATRLERLRASWLRDFENYAPQPSLLHGDLWSGNAAQLADGTPTVFDPAVHYGDRECDLAMAALFGGFGNGFFEAYEDAWPLESGWPRRREFYQLYHVLNHANLFGGGYVADARRRIDRLAGR